MKKLFAALASAFLACAPVYAQTPKTKALITTEVNTNFADNTTNAITAALLRTTVLDLMASSQQYGCVNAQTNTTYTIAVGDYGCLITFNNGGAIAVTLPQANGAFNPFNVYIKNLGAGVVTITPTTSTIDGAATRTFTTGQSAQLFSDGANYFSTQFSSFVTSITAPITLSAGGALACGTCATTTNGGAITGTAPITVSAAGAISITGAAGQIPNGATGAFTATPTLGASGTLGSLTFGNATSGTLTLQTVTGALPGNVLSLPTSGGTDVLVTKASQDTLTNKTYDTAGTGNAFRINGTGITAVTGTGAVVLADSPVHTTLLTSPVLAGGSAASSTLALESTSGAGTTDKIQFKTASQAVRGTVLSNGNLGWGTETNPQNAITLSKNVATGLAGGGGYATIFGLDNDFPSLYVINFANGGGTFPIVGFKSAQGIGSAFTSSLSGDVLGSFSAVGASANNTFPGSNTGLVQFVAEENWNSTNQGTKILFVTTPKLSTGGARATALTAWGSSGVSISTGADPGANNFGAPGSILSTGPTSGVGYATGAGGTITQITTRSTGVTLNKVSGAITLVSAAGSTTPATFVLTNSAIAATDVVVINQKSGTDKYEIFITAVAAGSCAVTFFTTGGTTTEQPVFNFAVIKGVAS